MPTNPSDSRGFSTQLPGDGDTVVIPDGDPTGRGMPGRLLDASMDQVSLLIPTSLDADRYVSIELTNPLQRRKLRLRGSVRAMQRFEDGSYRVDCSLLTRLNPQDLQGLRRSPVWPTLCQ